MISPSAFPYNRGNPYRYSLLITEYAVHEMVWIGFENSKAQKKIVSRTFRMRKTMLYAK